MRTSGVSLIRTHLFAGSRVGGAASTTPTYRSTRMPTVPGARYGQSATTTPAYNSSNITTTPAVRAATSASYTFTPSAASTAALDDFQRLSTPGDAMQQQQPTSPPPQWWFFHGPAIGWSTMPAPPTLPPSPQYGAGPSYDVGGRSQQSYQQQQQQQHGTAVGLRRGNLWWRLFLPWFIFFLIIGELVDYFIGELNVASALAKAPPPTYVAKKK